MLNIRGICLIFISTILFANGGISGEVVDKSNGEPMVGVTVRVDGTDFVTWVDVNGSYAIRKVPAGTYTVVAEMTGFTTVTVTEVVVQDGETTNVSMEMTTDGIQSEMVVTADLLDDSEVGLLRQREKSVSISDAISDEMIGRTGAGTAADAVTKVTGASVVGGKYVFIRGLGDRYTTTQLNGTELPTADPDTKSFQMDLLPTKLIKNIVTQKSFTADKPGNFSGGIVDIGTKEFPGEFMFEVSLSGSYNSQTTGDDLLVDSAGLNWQGNDKGDRDLPVSLEDAVIPDYTLARRDEALANQLDQYSKAFSTQMTPRQKSAPYNGGVSLTTGNRIPLFDGDLGFLASLTYGSSVSSRPEVQTARWRLTENVGAAGGLANQSQFTGSRGVESVQWGGLFSANFLPNGNNEIGWTTLWSKVGESVAESYEGTWQEQFGDADAVLQSRFMKYSDREVLSHQLSGEHVLLGFHSMEISWQLSSAETTQYEPDTRIFTSHYSNLTGPNGDFRNYSITSSTYNNPARYFRELEETNDSFKVNFNLPLLLWNGQRGTLKWGISHQEKERDFFERRFEYVSDQSRYNGDPDEYFGNEVGLIGYDEQRRRYSFGTYIQEAPDSRGGNYQGTEDLDAAFVLAELPLTERFKVVAGLRYEKDEFTVTNADKQGLLDDGDTLPSLALIQNVADHMNLKFSYGRTLARPTFREKAPYTSYDFIADGLFVGNPNLERTLIDNFDLRWEWFRGAGEILAASVFYKKFDKPIEKIYNIKFASEFGEKTYENVDEAEVYGLELEARVQFEEWAIENDWNHIFGIGGNVSFIESEVNIPEEEYQFILQRDPDASPTRTLQGQSPFLANISLNYDNIISNTSATLNYNVFGERLEEVGFGGAPNVLEESRGTFDLIVSQPMKRGITLKFSAKNLSDEAVRFSQEFKGVHYTQTEYKRGRSFSLSVSLNP